MVAVDWNETTRGVPSPVLADAVGTQRLPSAGMVPTCCTHRITESCERPDTDIVTVPWLFYGVPMDGPLDAKLDGIKRFAKDVIEQW